MKKLTKPKKKTTPSVAKKEAERKRLIQEKRRHTINVKKRSQFIDDLYKKYSS